MDSKMATLNLLHSDHSRLFRLEGRPFYMVYPVVSRRAGGLSVGINLNLDKACNFDCIYCQVDRTVTASLLPANAPSEKDLILEELRHLFQSFDSGEFFRETHFGDLPSALRNVKDIAFSGDGEPTLAPSFYEVTEAVRGFLSEQNWGESTSPLLRLITNGSGLFQRRSRREVRRTFLDSGPGEVWLKLDAADKFHYERIDRSPIPFDRMMEGLDQIVIDFPVTIQTMVLDYRPENDREGFVADNTLWEPLLKRMEYWVKKGAKIEAWHLYSVARPPADSAVKPVSEGRLREWAREASAFPFPVQVFP